MRTFCGRPGGCAYGSRRRAHRGGALGWGLVQGEREQERAQVVVLVELEEACLRSQLLV